MVSITSGINCIVTDVASSAVCDNVVVSLLNKTVSACFLVRNQAKNNIYNLRILCMKRDGTLYMPFWMAPHEKGKSMGSLFSHWGLVYLHLFCYTVEPLITDPYGIRLWSEHKKSLKILRAKRNPI